MTEKNVEMMGWNEPPDGNKDKGKDPWGGRAGGEGPPDLDDLVRKLRQRIGGIFGGRPGGSDGGQDGGNSRLIWLLIIILVLGYLLFNITYFIDQQERGVVLRFGKYVETLQPGLNVVLPSFIDEVIPVNVGKVRSITNKATMLTQDENIVDVEEAVKWRVTDPARYVFNVLDPNATLSQVVESAIRSVIGKSKLDYVLTEGRSEIAAKQQQLMQKILDDYKSGIVIVAVNMQAATPPDEVKPAFDDVIKAREDEQRQVNEAEAYENDIIPRARGAAARVRQEANAYKATVIARAQGQTARFSQLLTEYERAPSVTRDRLYLDAMESVMSKSSKVLLDAGNNNNLIYLPLDKLLKNRGSSGGAGQSASSPATPSSTSSSSSPSSSPTQNGDTGQSGTGSEQDERSRANVRVRPER